MENNELTHFGIKGQRWGRRRYQNPDGSLTVEGIKRYRDKDPEGYEREKQNALRSGSASAVLKFKADLTDAEFASAKNRLNNEYDIIDIKNRYANQEIKAISDKLGNVKGAFENAAGIYNITAKTVNAFSTIELPVIGGSSKAEREEKKQKEAEEKAKKEKESWLRTATPDDIIKNWGNLSDADLKSYNTRESFRENILKRTPKSAADSNTNSSDSSNKSSGSTGSSTSNARKWKPETNSSSKSKNNDTIIDADWRDVTEDDIKRYGQLLLPSGR